MQLSDIHFSKSHEENPLQAREHSLHGALRSVASAGDHFLIIYSGDIANWGKDSEYELASEFIQTLDKAITEHTGTTALHAIVPGNHDLDFAEPNLSNPMRELVLSNISPVNPPDERMLDECLIPQRPFKNFITKIAQKISLIAPSRIIESQEITIESNTIRIHLLNTSQFSLEKEKPGTLWFQLNILENNLRRPINAETLTICAFHHPYNWYLSDNAKKMRSLIEEYSDIILTGHEHLNDNYQKTKRSTEQNIYIEGGVLQSHDEPELSTFNVIKIKKEEKAFLVTSFAWNGEIYEIQNEPNEYKYIRLRQHLLDKFDLTIDWSNWLDQVGTDFRHQRCLSLTLNDIFVYPDLQKLDVRKSCTPSGMVKDGEIIGYIQEKKRVCIAGAEKSGKTSLAKRLFVDLRSAGLIPILVGSDFLIHQIKKDAFQDKIRHLMDQKLVKIYDGNGKDLFWQAKQQDRVLIIDDYDRLDLSLEGRNTLLEWCDKNFGVVVLIASPGIRLSDILDQSDKNLSLLTYEHLDILESDSETRYHLIRKWLIAGTDKYQTNADDIYKETIRYSQIISGMIGQGVVPSLPLFVLIMMQQMEGGTNVEATNGLYGSLYEVIIRDVLKDATRDPGDFEIRLNYLTEFAYKLYTKNAKSIDDAQFRLWHDTYCEVYNCILNGQSLVLQFKAIGVFKKSEDNIWFKYKYYYCFFLARYISQHMHEPEILAIVENFCNNLHNSDATNIMLFLCHLSKDPIILSLIMKTVKNNFKEASEYDIQTTPALALTDLGSAKLSIGTKSAEAERLMVCEQQDSISRPHGLDEVGKSTNDFVHAELMPLVNEANSAHHSIRICGQILRNFYGSMKGALQEEIIKECYGVSLRMMTVLFKLLEKEKEEIAGELSEVIRHRYPNLSDPDVDIQTRKSIYGFAMLIIYGLIKHTSNCLGLAALKPSFDKIITNEKISVSQRVLDISTRLDFFDEFPETQILGMLPILDEGTIGREALRLLVWEHFKLFRRDYKLRQRVCSKFNIEISQPAIVDISEKRQLDGQRVTPTLMPNLSAIKGKK